MRKIVFTFIFLSGFARSFSQDAEKISIAVLPFSCTVNGQNNYAGVMQELVTKEFVKGNRFIILDRSKFQRVLDELKVQKSEEFLNSKIVEQGRMAGAQYLVTGVLNEIQSKKEVKSYYDYSTNRNKTSESWKADIRLSFQVIDVATGSAIYTENISSTNGMAHTTNAGDAMDNAQCKVKKQIRNAVMKLFPEEIQIVKVEKTTKKGLPELVLISAGSRFFDEGAKKDECEPGILGIFSKKDVVKLKVYEVEILNVGGKEMKREKQVGVLKLKEVQGDFSVCEVNEGEKEIQERLNGNQKLLVKIL